MNKIIHEIIKYLILLGLSAAILLAGFVLPERFLAKQRNDAINYSGQIEAESVNPYGDEYKLKKEKLSKSVKMLRGMNVYERENMSHALNPDMPEMNSYKTVVKVLNSDFDFAKNIYDYQETARLEQGYELLTSFVFSWNKSFLEFISQSNEVRLLQSSSGAKLGVIVINRVSPQTVGFEDFLKIPVVAKIYFDISTGIPMFIRIDNVYITRDELISMYENCIAELKKSLEVEIFITSTNKEQDKYFYSEAISGDQAFSFESEISLSKRICSDGSMIATQGNAENGEITYSYLMEREGKNGERFYSICFEIFN